VTVKTYRLKNFLVGMDTEDVLQSWK